ncbi:alginate O-acetyltransferase [Synergistales bacterium]|nr:alginate O-acetyltransferase [Synergistales bacterium]
MVFSSVIFVLVFLPIVLAVHSLLLGAGCWARKRSLWGGNEFLSCNMCLLGASLVFYAWGEPYYVFIMIISAAANYLCGAALARADSRRGLILAIGILLNLGLLGYYKYMGMLSEFVPEGWRAHLAGIALPLGISFYTFQGMSYLIDVYRSDVKSSRGFVNFACYLTMFPQLVAGPIVRYSSIDDELSCRRISWERFAGGASRFIIGLAKKLFIADTLARVADAAFAVPTETLPAFGAWAGIAAYGLQIYYDFSGYSDMAIGMGHMLGFTFPENFSYPYAARSMRDYWRRWHISLSAWFRDYLYIPMGGSKNGRAATAFNLIVVFAACGLWHGASLIFLAWGLYHGCFLALERIFPRMTERMPAAIRHFYVIAVFLMGWVLFRADSFSHALGYYKALLGFYDAGVYTNRLWLTLFQNDKYMAFIIGVICAAPVIPRVKAHFEAFAGSAAPLMSFACYAGRALILLLLLLMCYMPLFGKTYTPFIYFRF